MSSDKESLILSSDVFTVVGLSEWEEPLAVAHPPSQQGLKESFTLLLCRPGLKR